MNDPKEPVPGIVGEPKPCIYMIRNTLDNKCFIGQADRSEKYNVNERMQCHSCGKDHCRELNAAIRKDGWENFMWSIITESDDYTKADLNRLEQYYINLFWSFKFREDGHGWGYNLTRGGAGIWGYKFTKEQKAKVAAASRGRKYSESAKANMRKAQQKRFREQPVTMETRRKKSKAMQKHFQSTTARQKIAKSVAAYHEKQRELGYHKGTGSVSHYPSNKNPFTASIMINRVYRKLGNHATRDLAQQAINYFLEHGEPDPKIPTRATRIQAKKLTDQHWTTFTSLKEAALKTPVSKKSIQNMCKDKLKSCKGWTFRYA